MQYKFLRPAVCIFAAAFLLTLVACNSVQPASTSEATTEVHAPEEIQIYLPHTMLDHFENCKYTYDYNEYGNEISTTKETLTGEILATWLNTYDEAQNLIQRTVDTGDGTPFVQLKQTYDDKGNLLERREYTTTQENVITYQYDEQSRVISKKVGGEVTETYTYAEDGSYKMQSAHNPDEYRMYNKNGKVAEWHLDAITTEFYSYNEDGILTEAATYSDGNMTRKLIYQHDEHGNTIKITRVFASGRETVLSEYTYKLYTVKP